MAPRVHGRLQPLCALYTPRALAAGLAASTRRARTTDVVEALGVRVVDGLDETAFFNVNAPEDLLQASRARQGREPAMSSRWRCAT